MNVSFLENRDKLCFLWDIGYICIFVIFSFVFDRLYIERGRGDWVGIGGFRY